jgi:hypothetical protein
METKVTKHYFEYGTQKYFRGKAENVEICSSGIASERPEHSAERFGALRPPPRRYCRGPRGGHRRHHPAPPRAPQAGPWHEREGSPGSSATRRYRAGCCERGCPP